jgi:hypothetical protein
MDSMSICKIKNCKKFFLEPVVLPCKNNICKSHIVKNESNKFDCEFCNSEHDIPDGGFTLNSELNNMIQLSLHLNDKEKDLQDLIKLFETSMIELNVINKYPENYIVSCVANVRNKIEIEKERLITKIESISNTMLSKLKSFEEECITNLDKKLASINEQYSKHLDNLTQECSQLKEETRTPKMSLSKLDDLTSNVNKLYKDNQDKLVEYKNSLQMGKRLLFNSKNLEITQDMFGEFLMDETESVCVRSTLNSRILNAEQAKNLISLCGFSNNDRFKLIYRATKDGFAAKDFHKRCDNISKTLTIIKVKDKPNIFGGFTELSWDSCRTFARDEKAFIFSLVNQENKPIKINVDRSKSSTSIYCYSSCGPTFGDGDFCIETNSNINCSSSSSLGNTYQHPDYEAYSSEAMNFLAGSNKFLTREIEVFQLL